MSNGRPRGQSASDCDELAATNAAKPIIEASPFAVRKKLCTGCPFGVVDWALLGAKRANQWSTDSQKWPPPSPAAVIPDPSAFSARRSRAVTRARSNRWSPVSTARRDGHRVGVEEVRSRKPGHPAWFRHDGKASRLFTTLPDVPHRGVSYLQMTGETFAVEERIDLTIARQLLPCGGKQARVPRQSQGERLIMKRVPIVPG